eukprot:794965-Pleurochrysis_carterae.AAC.1
MSARLLALWSLFQPGSAQSAELFLSTRALCRVAAHASAYPADASEVVAREVAGRRGALSPMAAKDLLRALSQVGLPPPPRSLVAVLGGR